ncbi:MAG: hypothetical protein FH757_08540 [Alcanivorax sp.]|jgi:hypothetical protein|nr:hypothetical protein [Alcanivorax sp.]
MKTRIIKRKGTLLSSVAMLSTAMLLTACGGDGGDSPVDDGGANPGESGAQALLYAYPDNGQNEISTAAPVVLRFSSAVNLGEAQNSITVYEGDAQTGTVVAVTPESVAGEPNNVLLQPDEDLKPNQTYTVVIEDLRLRKGTAKDQTLTFTTRPLHEGPKNLVVKDDTFEVSRRMPDGSAMEPVMDFSSFRFQFTQPIDRATASYGDGNTVVLRDSAGDPVDATLLIDGAYMTVDPDAEYLNAGETYTLDITAGLTSTYGETLGAQSYTLTPKDSSPKGEPAILVQKLTQGSTSRLTGKPVNEVPVNGTLLGENKNITQASAEVVRAELADVTTYTDVTPIRLPKGTVLNGAEINPILIGGEVPAGFGSGDVTMTVLSDASGYLVPNPYAENNPDALRIVHLLMDVGIATSEPRANGAFTQDLLHIELVGLAEVDPTAGVLNLDAVSVVEPNILGQEYGYGMLSFQLQSYKDQNDPPKLAEDTTPPTLQSWMPGENTDLQKPGEPIVLNFSEPLDRNSLRSAVSLSLNGQPFEFDLAVDGASVVVKPKRSMTNVGESSVVVRYSHGLEHSLENSPKVYNIKIEPSVTDLAGNELNAGIDETFELATVVQNKEVITPGFSGAMFDSIINHAPVVLSVYPGFPCALSEDGRNLSMDLAGRCKGSFPGINDGTDFDNQAADDSIPVMAMPGRRPIIVQFSEEIDADSVVLKETFSVYQIDDSESILQEVEGKLEIFPKRLVFTPNQAWHVGDLYKYTLASSGYEIAEKTAGIPAIFASPNYECGVTAICDRSGLPIQTQPLGITTLEYIGDTGNERDYAVLITGPEMDAGGPSMTQYFRGVEESNNVVQVLSTMPLSDTNHNFFHENPNLGTSPDPSRSIGVYDYEVSEYGPTTIPDQKYPQFDPSGVKPAPNSAKLLSRFDSQGDLGVVVNGANIGCDYQFPTDVPLECPEEKFTYLSSAIVAEVTDQVSNEGLKVLMWPSQVMGTSLPLFGLSDFGILIPVPGMTGPQILRMRFNESGSGQTVRNKPIEAWIKDRNGQLTLEAEVDLYVNAPYVTEYGVGALQNTANLTSYRITMQLRGPVNFLDDGRMTVEQFNINPVDIMLKLHGRDQGAYAGYVDLFIPEEGSRLNFVSEPIK